jgi:hypothetical protein
MEGSVFQPWFTLNGWKMQSIFVNGLRAPDTKTRAVKKVVRWMRVQVCNNADPNKPDCYMSAPLMTNELIEEACDECEYLSCHYVHHLADALRIIALFHPNYASRQSAKDLHFLIAEEIFHFVPESDEQFKVRHVDKVPAVSGGIPIAVSEVEDVEDVEALAGTLPTIHAMSGLVADFTDGKSLKEYLEDVADE